MSFIRDSDRQIYQQYQQEVDANEAKAAARSKATAPMHVPVITNGLKESALKQFHSLGRVDRASFHGQFDGETNNLSVVRKEDLLEILPEAIARAFEITISQLESLEVNIYEREGTGYIMGHELSVFVRIDPPIT